MALVVGSAAVASGMSPLVQEALYADDILQDGVTFTSRYQKSEAGQIQVVKYTGDESIEPQVPGSDFNDSEYANGVVDINCVNGFPKSQKVPSYYVATMPINVKAGEVIEVTKAVRNGRQKSALACLLHEGTASSVTTAIDSTNIESLILDERAAMRKAFARPDVVLASVDVYNTMLKVAGAKYTPVLNDEVVRTARIGFWMGMLWIEAPHLGQDYTLKYKDGTKTNSVDTDNVELVMYDHSAFSVIDVLSALRIVDSEDFFGSKIQMEIDSGFKVTNDKCVRVKSHA